MVQVLIIFVQKRIWYHQAFSTIFFFPATDSSPKTDLELLLLKPTFSVNETNTCHGINCCYIQLLSPTHSHGRVRTGSKIGILCESYAVPVNI